MLRCEISYRGVLYGYFRFIGFTCYALEQIVVRDKWGIIQIKHWHSMADLKGRLEFFDNSRNAFKKTSLLQIQYIPIFDLQKFLLYCGVVEVNVVNTGDLFDL